VLLLSGVHGIHFRAEFILASGHCTYVRFHAIYVRLQFFTGDIKCKVIEKSVWFKEWNGLN
jgi:hypothetical protein